jgi:hypothetical protein
MSPTAAVAESVREPRAVRLNPGDLEVETLVVEELENAAEEISYWAGCDVNQHCFQASCGDSECLDSCYLVYSILNC